eukprot:scaffold23584_cov75-Phaeocystis_antarctica.AAC.4
MTRVMAPMPLRSARASAPPCPTPQVLRRQHANASSQLFAAECGAWPALPSSDATDEYTRKVLTGASAAARCSATAPCTLGPYTVQKRCALWPASKASASTPAAWKTPPSRQSPPFSACISRRTSEASDASLRTHRTAVPQEASHSQSASLPRCTRPLREDMSSRVAPASFTSTCAVRSPRPPRPPVKRWAPLSPPVRIAPSVLPAAPPACATITA